MKRDRIQIVAEIINSCRSPQTETYIRRQTNISCCASKLHYATASARMVRACGRELRSKEIKNNGKRINLFGKIVGTAKNRWNKK